jgi:hypothetical protein
MAIPQASFLPSTAPSANQFFPTGTVSPNADLLQVFNASGQVVFRICADGTIVQGLQTPAVTVSTNTTLSPTLPNIYVSGGPPSGLTMTLTSSTTFQQYFIWNSNGVGPVTVVGSSGTVGGAASYTLPVGRAASFTGNGSTSASNFTAVLRVQS